MSKQITAEEFDRLVDEGEEDVTQYLDFSKMRRPGLEKKAVEVELPVWVIDSLDKEAKQSKVSRQSVIRHLLESHLRKASA